jgi:hypothetical protein
VQLRRRIGDRPRPQAASLGGILGWWSLFNLPREILPDVLASFREALMPGGHLIIATHAGDQDVARTEAYNGVPVTWTTYQWRAERLTALLEDAALHVVSDLRLPAEGQRGPVVVLQARREE